jgi:hypothetical protein
MWLWLNQIHDGFHGSIHRFSSEHATDTSDQRDPFRNSHPQENCSTCHGNREHQMNSRIPLTPQKLHHSTCGNGEALCKGMPRPLHWLKRNAQCAAGFGASFTPCPSDGVGAVLCDSGFPCSAPSPCSGGRLSTDNFSQPAMMARAVVIPITTIRLGKRRFMEELL